MYGLAGRLPVEGVGSGGSSRGSRGETSSSVESSQVLFDTLFAEEYPWPLDTG